MSPTSLATVASLFHTTIQGFHCHRLNCTPTSSPTPRSLWDFFSCPHLFKAFEFHFILQLCIWRDLKFLIPSTSKTIAVKWGWGGRNKHYKEESSKLSIQLHLLHRKMETKTLCKFGMCINHYYKTKAWRILGTILKLASRW